MKKIKILLAGTPNFAVPIFEEIIHNFEVVGIVSQPDRAANRGYKTLSTPTKLLAQKYQIKLFQPEKIKDIQNQLSTLDFDFLLTAAYGQYIPMNVLALPKIAAINIHGSLLPKYRGAGPIQHTILNGDQETGISLIYMSKEMDAGDILAQAKLAILPSDTTKELFEKLSSLAKKNIVEWLNALFKNLLIPQKQNQQLVTLSPKINKSFAEFYLTDDVATVWKKIRALNDNPGAFIFFQNKRLKVFRASLEPIKHALKLPLKNGILYCYEYQYESKKRVFITNA